MRTTTKEVSRRSVAATMLAAAAICVLTFLLAPAASSAAAPPQLWQRCDADEPAGQRCSSARGIAANPVNGRVYVADAFNSRIVEFTAVGEFVKAWGWDVVQSGPGDDTVAPEDQFEVCVPEDGDTCKAGAEGTGAGQFALPQGVALDSAGNVYVADKGIPANRVQKFSRKGELLAAWGGDVVFSGPDDSANDEQQQLTVAASAGSFRLGLPSILSNGEREETAPLPFNASAASVQAALNALPTIGGLGGSVSVSGGPGDASGSSPYLIAFEGNMGGDDVPKLSVALDVGTQLKCSSPTAAEAISYQWLRNGSKIAGATSSTYTATAADEDKAIQCQVTAKNANAGSTQVSQPPQVIAPMPKKPVPTHPEPIPAPQASAPLSVGGGGGQTLSCDADQAGWNGWNTGESAASYRWYRNGVQIGSAESSTYKATAADLATPAVFQCSVSTSSNFESETLTSVKVSANLATTPSPSSPPAPEAQASTSPGNGVVTVADGGGPEICKPADECKGGTEGTANGEFGEWANGSFIAITPTDKVYVGDEGRIQRFDTGGAYQDEIALPGKTVDGLATDAAGDLYAIYSGVIHKLSPSGEPLPPSFEVKNPGGGFAPAFAVAVDAAGHLHAFALTHPAEGTGVIPTIFEFDPAGSLVNQFGKGEFGSSAGLATNLCAGSEAPGNLYVSNASQSNAFLRAYGTEPIGCFKARTLPATGIEETAATLNGTVNPSGSLSSECRFQYGTTTAYGNTVPCAESPAQIGAGEGPVPVHADLSGLEKGTVHHFRLRARIEGETETGADEQFKTLGPPLISGDRTTGAAYTEATLKALVNPEGFPTTYRVEYTTQADFQASGFKGAQSSAETAVGSDRSDHPVSVTLQGLAPGTTYRWRVVATNSSGVSAGEARTVNTYRQLAPDADCPNQAFRTAASVFLPDCRAYEMVSPIDKNGGDIVRGSIGTVDTEGYVQARPDGEKLTYTSLAPFGELQSSVNINQYLAERRERGEPGEGWSSRGIRPQVSGQEVDEESDVFNASRQFMAFTPDLCFGWLIDHQTPPLSADGQDGYPNLYRRQNCEPGEGGLEALTDVEPPEGTVKEYIHRIDAPLEGVSADGRHAFFVANAKLTPEAPAGGGLKLYDRFGGTLHLVSVLPGGTPVGSAGVGSGFQENLEGAVSADGSGVYFTAGKIYLRLHPEQGVVAGECSKASKACTVPVSAGSGFFWAGSEDGSKAVYTEGGTLYEFDLGRYEAGEEAAQSIAGGVVGVAGVAKDLSHVYFVSRQALPGAGANSEGDEALAGQPNLYLHRAGEGGAEAGYAFVGTLDEKDVGQKEPGATITPYDVAAPRSFARATRVSADGTAIGFNSRAPLSGYDNTDTASGRAAVEVFAYQAEEGELSCASCNPSGARPGMTREMREVYPFPWDEGLPTKVPAAAWIPTWEQPLHASNLLSADGSRLFFNSYDALVPRDTNGAQDVYQWEAPGTGGCDLKDPHYFAQNGGCLYLISSGESPSESEFWEASADGEDVFFTTASSLLPQDPGSVDLYDARVGGGFPQPTQPPACEGETCQSPAAPPNDPTPASSAFRGPGNLTQEGARHSCRKGKVRRRGRCVNRRKSQGKGRQAEQKRRRRDANHNRRAPR